jgi:iron complex transport system substrate-binding protein
VNIAELGGTSPSVEELIKLEPDLVIIHPSTAASGFAEQIRDVGIPAININFNNYETMSQAYTIVGEILGGEYQEKLNTWCTETDKKITYVRSLTEDLAEEERPVVFYIAGQVDSMTTTMPADSIFSDWTESAGGIYGTRLMDVASSDVTAEAIFDLNPDVIIVGGVWQHSITDAIETTAGWKDLNAVKNNRVYKNPYACFNWDRFGLESQLQISYALMRIQPEIADANGIDREFMIKEVQNFYETYTDFELTKQQAEYMLDGLSPDGTEYQSTGVPADYLGRR